ncbi:MAG TPA: hypothetical protein VM553_08125 [Dongiaceae bacterium]|nr:hypothetical protein [Dongiaceae bacterium]
MTNDTLASGVFRRRSTFVLALTFLLSLPALWAGMMGDDYMHYAVLNAKNLPIGKPDDLSLFGLFSFINGDPERNRQAMDLGVLPWWTYGGMKYAFWRPVSEAFHWLDHQLWPRMPGLMHLHSILWYLALCVLLTRLYRKTLGAGIVALLALALYALDSTHGFTISWIANRNALISTLFGLLSLWFYLRWREEDRLGFVALSLLCLLTSLLSAELGISSYGYLGAYALTLDKKGKLKGCLATLPHLTVIIIWWLIYKQAGFGATNADAYYIDPAAQPLGFLSVVAERLPVLLASQWGIIPAEIYGFVLEHDVRFVVGCVIFLLLVGVPAVMACRQVVAVRFWLLGMLFSLLPAATALPHDRVLLFAGAGAAPVLAHLLRATLPKGAKIAGLPIAYTRPVAFLLVFVHLILSPLLYPLMIYSTKLWAGLIPQEPSRFADLEPVEHKRLVIFGAPLPSALAIAPFRFYREESIPERIWVISTLRGPYDLIATADNQLQIDLPTGFIQEAESKVRDLSRYPFHEGDQVDLSGMTITVSRLNDDGKPTRLTLTFDRSLQDETLQFIRWDNKSKAYEVLTPHTP